MDLWSLGRYDLGLSEAEFWDCTPRQFFALLKRFRESKMRAEHGPAMIVSALSGGKSRMDRFMPTLQIERRARQKLQGTQTEEEKLAKLERFTRAMRSKGRGRGSRG